MDELKELAFDKENWPNEKITNEEVKNKYRIHKLKLDPSKENHYLYELIDKFNESNNFTPDSLPDFDFGIYENRILSMISYRIAMKRPKSRKENDARMILQCVNYSHGFDTEDHSIFDKATASATYLSIKNTY